jgi:Fe-S cluster assembly iron-binding protein IscA
MFMITVTPEAIQAIKLFLEEKGIDQPIRIHLQSTGCCDASLGLMADDACAEDLTEEVQGILFVVSPEVSRLTGGITLSYSQDKYSPGFVLTSERPISEWAGFGVCTIKG